MELQDLAKKLGVKAIIVSHFNHVSYKDHITIIVNNDLAIDYMGKTYAPIPLTVNGIDKSINTSGIKKVLDAIKKELADKKL